MMKNVSIKWVVTFVSVILISGIFGAVDSASGLDLNKLKKGVAKGAEEGIKTGKLEGAKKGAEVGVKTAAEEYKKPDSAASAPATNPSTNPNVEVKPSIICDAKANAGICYAFSGQKHMDDHKKGLEKQAAKKAKPGSPVCANDFACRLFRGKYQESGLCPVENLLGRCTIKKGDPEEYTLHYYKGGKIKDPAKDCADPKSPIHRQGSGLWLAY